MEGARLFVIKPDKSYIFLTFSKIRRSTTTAIHTVEKVIRVKFWSLFMINKLKEA